MNYVLEPYVFDITAKAPVDLFDDKGRLVVTKGEDITEELTQLAKTQQLFTLHVAGDCQTDMFHEVNLISVEYLIEACKAVNAVLAEIMNDSRLSQQFKKLRSFDKRVYEHSMNVALLAYIIGKRLGIEPSSLKELTLGALLHDFGKLSIALTILNKPGQLTSDEYEIIKSHPALGVKALAMVNLSKAVTDGIAKHHERWNGSGYPNSLCGEEIPLNAQIIAVADVFDAITADRPYRPGLPPYHALEMLVRGMNSDFSPEIVQAFAKMLKLYPQNSWVTLNTGEVGTVTAVNMEYPTRPTVRLLFDKYGEPVQGTNEIDLCEDKERFVCSIKYMKNEITTKIRPAT
ncbi:MAG: HD-GYP domain-containing protein [Pelosinus sp.]|nr:HD-GYP domain-containing protein [Pelosinus sp.]